MCVRVCAYNMCDFPVISAMERRQILLTPTPSDLQEMSDVICKIMSDTGTNLLFIIPCSVSVLKHDLSVSVGDLPRFALRTESVTMISVRLFSGIRRYTCITCRCGLTNVANVNF